jgi:hypothetical protein
MTAAEVAAGAAGAVPEMQTNSNLVVLGAPAGEQDDVETSWLWMRISVFELDDAKSPLPYSARLARENGWSRNFACRVIEEYKRFCYIAVTASHGVTPSDQVDQAWHLHLLYTRSYWDGFCSHALGRPLHHGPTRGGTEETDKFRSWYEQTLKSYERSFGPPPRDIWPDVETRFAQRKGFLRVDLEHYWLVRRPCVRSLWLRRRRFGSLAVR